MVNGKLLIGSAISGGCRLTSLSDCNRTGWWKNFSRFLVGVLENIMGFFSRVKKITLKRAEVWF